ncbi:MAG TPA: hypothetical protein VGE45_00520 [Chloroflexia bacterium]
MAAKKRKIPLYAACRVVTTTVAEAGPCTFCNNNVEYSGVVRRDDVIYSLRWRKNSQVEHSINFCDICAEYNATLLMKAKAAYEKGAQGAAQVAQEASIL